MTIQKKSPTFWIFSTYFAEGFPYMVTKVLSFVFFTDAGVREAWLGFLNFLGIPWNLKFLWAPFVDLVSTKRSWMLKVQFLLSIFMMVLAILAGFYHHHPSNSVLAAIAFVFCVLAFLGATNDVTIDGYYLEALTDRKEQAAYSGLRTLAYRVAVVYSRILLVGLAGLASWFWGFTVGALTMFAIFVFHRVFLPVVEVEKREKKVNFTEAFRSYFDQKKIILILCFVATYKLGDEILFAMNTPFLMRELLVSKTQLAWLSGAVGAASTVAGSLLAAWWVKKKTLKKAIWPLTLLMNINILAYVALAYFKPIATTTTGMTIIAAVHGYEQWAAGLGGTVLMIYLMRLCKTEFKAAHYAIGSAIISLGSTFIGGFGGFLVEAFGYTTLFTLGFLASIPSMLMLFWIPLHEEG
ncbi:MAG: MFS transporter [Deltaproteobacteria bacterium]|nr:MFS transporter [Deltaproteobacteria bacterium]